MTINGAVQADPWNVASVLVGKSEIQKYLIFFTLY